MPRTTFLKDPDAVLDYYFDWNDSDDPWLESGETITERTVTVDTGLTKDSDSESDGIVAVWLSGGTAGETYAVACKIVTNNNRTDERTIYIKVKDR